MEWGLEPVKIGVATIITVVVIAVATRLLASSRGQHLPSSEIGRQKDKPAELDEFDKPYKVWRIRGVPVDWDRRKLQSFLKKKLENVSPTIKSLALEIHGNSQTATAILPGELPAELCIRQADENFPAQFLTLQHHFLGITTLYRPPKEDHKVDLIAVNGLGGHAFGSFKQRKGEYMWLLDSLPFDLQNAETGKPMARIMIYGQESKVADSKCMENLDDMSISFYTALGPLASASEIKPILLLGHSLGGLIVKGALNSMMSPSTDMEYSSFARAVRGIVFFGVPHNGMDIDGLQEMAGNQLNRQLIDSLSNMNSAILKALRDTFDALLDSHTHAKVFCFYELSKSKISARNKDGKWSQEAGTVEKILVSQTSATHCRLSEKTKNQVCGIKRSHSEMVKLERDDDEYDKVRSRLQQLAEHAVQTRFWRDSTSYTIQLDSVTKACLKSLAFDRMDERRNNVDSARPGTFSWLTSNDAYRGWMSASQGLLCINGKPGSGKSTLLRHAFSLAEKDESIKSSRTFVASFFFHDRGSELQKDPLGFLRSVLHQILKQHPEALGDLVDSYSLWHETQKKKDEEKQWQVKELQKYLQSSVSKLLKDRPVLLYVDALDESGKENAVNLASEFASLVKIRSSFDFTFRICFSSRHYPILGDNYEFKICLETENKDDISTYVHGRLETNECLGTTLVPDMIINGAAGVFLWARLVIDNALELERAGHSVTFIAASVRDIPKELDGIYEKLVKGMEQKKESLKLVRWICFSRRPLTPDELRWAMIVDNEKLYPTSQDYQNMTAYIEDDQKMMKRLNFLSCGLAEARTSKSGKEHVELIHQSVKEFFLESGLLILAESLQNGERKLLVENMTASANLYLARACIQYLGIKHAAGSTWKDMPCFFDYALEFWQRHILDIRANELSPEAVFDVLPKPEDFLKTWQENLGISMRSQSPPDGLITWSGYFPFFCKGMSWAHLAAKYHLTDLLAILLSTSTGKGDAAKIDEEGRTALMYAFVGLGFMKIDGQADIVGMILGTNKADLNAKDIDGRTAVSYAAEHGNETALRMLLDTGNVDVNDKDIYSRTAVSYAAMYGNETTLRMLLDIGNVDVNDKDIYGRTAVSYAAEHGNETALRMLLDIGNVDVNDKDIYGRTAVSYAAKHGNETTLRMLLDTGTVDVNSKDNSGQTPLLAAAKRGFEGDVKIILEISSVDVNVADNTGQTPLLWAIEGRHQKVVKMLLETSKVDVNLADFLGRKPLLVALKKRDQEVLEMLLETGKLHCQSFDKADFGFHVEELKLEASALLRLKALLAVRDHGDA